MRPIWIAIFLLLSVGCRESSSDRVTENSDRPIIEETADGVSYMTFRLINPDLGLSPEFSIWLVDRTRSSLKTRVFLDEKNTFQVLTSDLDEGHEYSFHFMTHEGRSLGTWDWALTTEGLQYQVRYAGSGEGVELPEVSLQWSETGWIVSSALLGAETPLLAVGSAQAISSDVFPVVALPDGVEGVRFGEDLLVESSQDVMEIYTGSDFAKHEAMKRSKRVYLQVLGQEVVAAKMIFSGTWSSNSRLLSRVGSRLLEFGSFGQGSLLNGIFGFSASWVVGKPPKPGDHVVVNIQKEDGDQFDYPVAYSEGWDRVPQVVSLSAETSYTPIYGETVMDGLTQAFAVNRNVETFLLELLPPYHAESGELAFSHEAVYRVFVCPEFYQRDDQGVFTHFIPSGDEYSDMWTADVTEELGRWVIADHRYEIDGGRVVNGRDVFEIPVGIFATRAKSSVKVRVIYETLYGLVSTLFWIDFP